MTEERPVVPAGSASVVIDGGIEVSRHPHLKADRGADGMLNIESSPTLAGSCIGGIAARGGWKRTFGHGARAFEPGVRVTRRKKMTMTQSFLLHGAALSMALAGLMLWEAYGIPIALMSAYMLC